MLPRIPIAIGRRPLLINCVAPISLWLFAISLLAADKLSVEVRSVQRLTAVIKDANGKVLGMAVCIHQSGYFLTTVDPPGPFRLAYTTNLSMVGQPGPGTCAVV